MEAEQGSTKSFYLLLRGRLQTLPMAHVERRIVSFILCLILIIVRAHALEPRGHEILVLTPVEPYRPSMSLFVNGLQARLDRRLPGTNILLVEQGSGWDDATLNADFKNWSDEKYRNRKPDAIGLFARNMPGNDYVSSWTSSQNAFSDLVGQQIQGVLRRETGQAVLEWQSSGEDSAAHWLEIRCDALQWSQGGVVLSHLDITERKKIEMQAQINLQTLSRFHRIAALGELAGALAHELNHHLLPFS